MAGRADDESGVFDVIFKRILRMRLFLLPGYLVSGDLRIPFSNGIVFEVFTPSMRKDEFWRLIYSGENYENEHFIVFEQRYLQRIARDSSTCEGAGYFFIDETREFLIYKALMENLSTKSPANKHKESFLEE